MGWKFFDTGQRTAAENMALDEALLADLAHEAEPILHFYDWIGDAATYGYFIEPENYLNLDAVAESKLDLAKRPTGGGIVFHNCDLAFSVLVPASHSHFSNHPLTNYAFVNQRVIESIQKMTNTTAELLPNEPQPLDPHCRHFCMAKPTKYDVMIQGKKIGGAAQRKTKHGFLHQGSISLGFLSESYLRSILVPETQVFEGMRQNSFALLGDNWTQKELEEARKELRQLLQQIFNEV